MEISLRKALPLFLLLVVLTCLCLIPAAYADGLEDLVNAVNNHEASFTVTEDTVIPSGLRLEAWDTQIIVSAGKTLTVEGNVNTNDLVINGSTVLNRYGFVYARDITLGTSGRLFITGNNSMKTYYESGKNLIGDNRVIFGEDNVLELELPASSAADFNGALAELKTVTAPHYIGRIRVNSTFTLSRTAFDLNSTPVLLEVAEGAKLTLPAGSTLNAHKLVMYGSSMQVNGTLYANAEIVLNGDENSFGSISFASENCLVLGPYAGIRVHDVADPESHIHGLNLDRFSRSSDGQVVLFRDPDALFAAFKEACLNREPYFNLKNMGTFEIQEDITIPAGMEVNANNTTFVVPVGKTVTVEGKLILSSWNYNGQPNALLIHEGGEVHIVRWSGMGLGVWHGWVANGNADRVTFEEDAGISLNGRAVTSSAEFSEELGHVAGVLSGGNEHLRCSFDVNYAASVTDNLTLPARCTLNLLQPFTISQGAAFTIDGTLHAISDVPITVNGTLVNNFFIDIEPRTNAAGAMLTVNGSYLGGGSFGVRSHDNTDSYFSGIDLQRYRKVEDEIGTHYYYEGNIIDDLIDAIDNHVESFTITEDATIPNDMRLESWDTQIIVAAGKTLTVEGNLNVDYLKIDGTMTMKNWGFVYADMIDLGPQGRLNITGNNHVMTYYDNSKYLVGDDRIHFGDKANNFLLMSLYVTNRTEFHSAVTTLKAGLAGRFVGDINVGESFSLSGRTYDLNTNPIILEVTNGATLTVPASATLNATHTRMGGGTLVVNGTLIANDELRVESDGTTYTALRFANDNCLNMTGTGSILVRDPVNPTAYIQGLDLTRFDRIDHPNEVVFRDSDGLFTAFKQACQRHDAFFDLSNKSTIEIKENITIPAGMTVDANNTTFIVPVGKTVTVEGKLILSGWNFYGQTNALLIPEGGELHIVRWAGLAINIWEGWVASGSDSRVTFEEDAGFYFGGLIENDTQLRQALGAAVNVLGGGNQHLRCSFDVNYDASATGNLMLPERCTVNLLQSFTIPQGATFTIAGTLHADSDVPIIVNGTLVNGHFIDLDPRTNAAGAMLTVNGSYLGSGSFGVKSHDNTDSYFSGIDLRKYRKVEDDIGTHYDFEGNIIDDLKAAIAAGLPEFMMRYAGEAVFDEDITIPAGMTVWAEETRVVVPVGNTVTVAGKLVVTDWNLNGQPNALVIPEGGELHFASAGHGLYFGIWKSWMDNGTDSRVTFEDYAGITLENHIFDDRQMQDAFAFGATEYFQSNDHLRMDLHVHYPSTVPGDVVFANKGSIYLYDTFTVPEGVTLTVRVTLSAMSDTRIIVNGTLINYGFVEMMERNTATGAMLIINGRYNGTGTIGVKSHGNTDSYISGLNLSFFDKAEDEIGTRYFFHPQPDFNLPAALKEIGEEAFVGGKFSFAFLPEGTEKIGPRAFKNCRNLRFISIPESVASIDETAFDGVWNITIFGVSGSYAETFAEGKANIFFQPIPRD